MTAVLGSVRFNAQGGDWGAFITGRGIYLSPELDEWIRLPRERAVRVCNLQRWTPMASGGHFAALEVPHALVEDMRAFYRELREGDREWASRKRCL